MDMTGEHRRNASRFGVWQALKVAKRLKAGDPGSTAPNWASQLERLAVDVRTIDTLKAKFASELELVHIDAPERDTMQSKGQLGMTGFAKGGALACPIDANARSGSPSSFTTISGHI